jgi:large subunit ribosomal protein L10
LDRVQKEQLVATLNELFTSTNLVVVTCPIGLTVAQATDLRRQMRDAGAGYKVTKNRLTRLALKGTKFEPLSDLFTGPTAIAYSEDPVAAAKVAVGFAEKNEHLSVLGGAIGEQVLDVGAVTTLAKLPSLDELRSSFLGLLNTPATRIATVLQEPGAQLARVMNAYATKDEAA